MPKQAKGMASIACERLRENFCRLSQLGGRVQAINFGGQITKAHSHTQALRVSQIIWIKT